MTADAQPKRKRGRPPKNPDSTPKKAVIAGKKEQQAKVTDFFKGDSRSGKKEESLSNKAAGGNQPDGLKKGKANVEPAASAMKNKNGVSENGGTNSKHAAAAAREQQVVGPTNKKGGDSSAKAGNKERFACETCKATFSRKYDMEKHARTHTGEKPYKCGICGKRFAQVGSLSVHMRGHTGEMPHSCDTCGKGFAVKERLRLHQRTHTGKIFWVFTFYPGFLTHFFKKAKLFLISTQKPV